MSAYHQRCRVCEEVTEPLPVDACRRCDGPTDMIYDWELLSQYGKGIVALWRRPTARCEAFISGCGGPIACRPWSCRRSRRHLRQARSRL